MRNRRVHSQLVEVPDKSIRVIEEQEESINEEKVMKEEIRDIILSEMCSTDEKIHTDELKLETPKINTAEISEMPSEIKLEMSIEQSQSKLMQDVTLVSNVPTPFHNYVQPVTEQEITLPNRNITQPMTEWEISVPNRTTLGKSIPKLHTRQRIILGSKLTRRLIPTRLVRRIIPSDTKSMCRPLSLTTL